MIKFKNGFTLVELSIVLVIIGLLIGGILVAQSMIETVRVQSLVRQIQQYDVAIANFQSKYNGLPGDSSAMGCQTQPGDNNICDNGLIEESGGSCCNVWGAESAVFWSALQRGGFIYPNQGVFSSDPNGSYTTSGSNPTGPKLNLGKDSGIIVDDFAGSNYYYIAKLSGSSGGFWAFGVGYPPEPTIPAKSALAIDVKIDDGLADSGLDFDATGGQADIPCANGSAYNTDDSAALCILQIKLLANYGLSK